jgi:hypothetical protein
LATSTKYETRNTKRETRRAKLEARNKRQKKKIATKNNETPNEKYLQRSRQLIGARRAELGAHTPPHSRERVLPARRAARLLKSALELPRWAFGARRVAVEREFACGFRV